MGSWRKAYGALKDSTKVGLAKINSDFKDLDIAIVKATNHVECPPKERHVRKIFGATSVLRPRADVAYCIHALARRLHKTKSWIVAMKILIVIHRTLREGDPIFREELLNYSHRGQVLQISNFKDYSSPLAWDCSAWVRTYALFLEERLECFRVLKYDIEAERLVKSSQGSSTKGHSRTRDLGCQELLDQLPALQQLLFRLNGCQPEGAAFGNYLIQYALALVLKESFKIYCAINDGIINLVDMFFEMSRHDAIKALNIYKRAGHQAENLAEFYEFCKGLELARNFQFPTLRLPPPSFLATMEEYIKEAPRIGSMSSKALEYDEKNLLTYKEEEQGGEEEEEQKESPPGSPESPVENEENLCEEPQELASSDDAQPAALLTGDFLCLDEVNHDAAELEESNALALAIVPPGGAAKTSAISLFDGEASGWELALVTASSSNESHVAESKLAGGFNKLLLDSLYEDGETRKQMNDRGYGCGLSANPFERHDPFAMSNSIAPPTSVQMAMMAQQQQYYYLQQQQQNMMMPYPYQPNYPQQQVPMGAPNPFHDPFSVLPQSVAPHQGNQRLM